MEDFNINSKIIIFCLIICLLIPLSTVSASDINNTADDQVLSATPSVDTLSASVNPEQKNDTLSVQSDENILGAGSSSSNNILGDSNSGTYADLNKLIRLSTGVVLLSQNYTYAGSTDDSVITIRPSGTEPKIKIYYDIKDNDLSLADNKFEILNSAILKMIKEIS